MMLDTSREIWRGVIPTASPLVHARSPLVLALLKLKVAASVFLNSSFSFLGHSLYGSIPREKASCGVSCKRASVSVNALVDSGADAHIPSFDDARKMFTDYDRRRRRGL